MQLHACAAAPELLMPETLSGRTDSLPDRGEASGADVRPKGPRPKAKRPRRLGDRCRCQAEDRQTTSEQAE